jgi:hypothetical protein
VFVLNGNRAGAGIAFLVGGGAVAEFVAKACSSPQTVEINASKRAGTLMKWVTIGLAESAVMVAIAAAIDKKYAFYLVAGGVFEGLITYVEYVYGKQSGLANGGAETEVVGGYG